MQLTIDLTPDEIAFLQAVAGKERLDPAEYAGRLVRSHLPPLFTEQETASHGIHEPDPLSQAVARLTSRSSAEKAAARAGALATYQPRRPLPPGKTFSEAIADKWPGDEIDEQIDTALNELS